MGTVRCTNNTVSTPKPTRLPPHWKPIEIPDPPKPDPTTIDVSVGGYMGDSYRVHGDAESLLYEHLTQGYQPQSTREFHPTAGDWHQFWTMIDILGVWE